MKSLIIITLLMLVSLTALNAQSTFGAKQDITNSADFVYSVYAADLDGDGDADALSASWFDDKIAWYENVGAGNGTNGGSFGPEEIITTSADSAMSVFAIDIDMDGDTDVLSASFGDHKIAWYENVGAGNGTGGGRFGPQQIISTAANDPTDVYAIDIDGDGDADVLSASYLDDKIAWYENVGAGNGSGGGNFGPQQIITTAANGTYSVFATDMDGDGDADVLSASKHDNKIAWYENVGSGNGVGGGTFGPQRVISISAIGAWCVHAIDIDGDGDTDVVSASQTDGTIAWHENIGSGSVVFAPRQVISTSTNFPYHVFAIDLDRDGDVDVLSASRYDDKIAWYENTGAGSGVNGGMFGPQQIITTAADGASSVFATDLDGDGDPDVLSSSHNDDTISWYENFTPLPPVYPGSSADLALDIGINVPPLTTPGVHPVTTGDQIEIRFWSPLGTYNFTPPILVAQPFPTGSLPWGPILFPEVHIGTLPSEPYPPVVLYDGTFMGFTPGLSTFGFNTVAIVPPGILPISFMLQGFCLSPNPSNPVFTATAAQEIRVQ